MGWKLSVPIAVGLLAAGVHLHAHHAISEIYDEERTLILEGEVEAFLLGNPHSLLHVRVTDTGGTTRTWAIEWRAAERLERAGLDGAALTRGVPVAVCGYPGRDPSAYRLYLLNVARRDARAPLGSEAQVQLCARESAPAIADLTLPG